RKPPHCRNRLPQPSLVARPPAPTTWRHRFQPRPRGCREYVWCLPVFGGHQMTLLEPPPNVPVPDWPVLLTNTVSPGLAQLGVPTVVELRIGEPQQFRQSRQWCDGPSRPPPTCTLLQ